MYVYPLTGAHSYNQRTNHGSVLRMLKYSKRQSTEIDIPEIQQLFVWDSTKIWYFHIQIDNADLEAYGWQNINFRYNF